MDGYGFIEYITRHLFSLFLAFVISNLYKHRYRRFIIIRKEVREEMTKVQKSASDGRTYS